MFITKLSKMLTIEEVLFEFIHAVFPLFLLFLKIINVDIEEYINCPIGYELINDPVKVISIGPYNKRHIKYYERNNILRIIGNNNNKCPFTKNTIIEINNSPLLKEFIRFYSSYNKNKYKNITKFKFNFSDKIFNLLSSIQQINYLLNININNELNNRYLCLKIYDLGINNDIEVNQKVLFYNNVYKLFLTICYFDFNNILNKFNELKYISIKKLFNFKINKFRYFDNEQSEYFKLIIIKKLLRNKKFNFIKKLNIDFNNYIKMLDESELILLLKNNIISINLLISNLNINFSSIINYLIKNNEIKYLRNKNINFNKYIDCIPETGIKYLLDNNIINILNICENRILRNNLFEYLNLIDSNHCKNKLKELAKSIIYQKKTLKIICNQLNEENTEIFMSYFIKYISIKNICIKDFFKYDYFEEIPILLNHGLDINYKDKKKRTLPIICSVNNCLQSLAYLLNNYDFDLEEKDDFGFSLEDYMIINNQKDILNKYKNYEEIIINDDYVYTYNLFNDECKEQMYKEFMSCNYGGYYWDYIHNDNDLNTIRSCDFVKLEKYGY